MALFNKAQDPISSETHFWGAIGSAVALIGMVIKGVYTQDAIIEIISAVIFGICAILLYTASCIYHYCKDTSVIKNGLRKFDHSMIYVLIAGTYTPMSFKLLPLNEALVFLGVIWGVALAGIIMKMFWINAPRTLYTLIYLALGWAIVFKFPMLLEMPVVPFMLLAAGGIFYSIGAIFYIVEKPNISLAFGFHELFHIFILLGSLAHFACVYIYVL